ncbi:MAG: hypothetical protein MZV64_70575 [Ignavibacteriales bacterium]|nr:hypothetical protein [Ignavibacteriales bacterium]
MADQTCAVGGMPKRDRDAGGAKVPADRLEPGDLFTRELRIVGVGVGKVRHQADQTDRGKRRNTLGGGAHCSGRQANPAHARVHFQVEALNASARHGFAADGFRLTRIRHALVEIVRHDHGRLLGRDRTQDQHACLKPGRPQWGGFFRNGHTQPGRPGAERLPCHRSRPVSVRAALTTAITAAVLPASSQATLTLAAMAARSISGTRRPRDTIRNPWPVTLRPARYQEGSAVANSSEAVRGCASAIRLTLRRTQRKKLAKYVKIYTMIVLEGTI